MFIKYCLALNKNNLVKYYKERFWQPYCGP